MPTTNGIDQLRIGQLSLYFDLFDEAMPPSFRADRESFAEDLNEWLRRFGIVEYPGLIGSEVKGKEIGEKWAEGDALDVIVFAPPMGAPPLYAWDVIRRNRHVPVIILCAQQWGTVPDDYTTNEATRRCLTVGVPMITNVLIREGIAFEMCVGVLGERDLEEEFSDLIKGLGAARKVRKSRLGIFGEPIAGYLDVMATNEDYKQLGIEPVNISSKELTDTFNSSAEELSPDNDIIENYEELVGHLDSVVLLRSQKLCNAIETICTKHNINVASVNCHGECFRSNKGIGITACLAFTKLSTAGIPFACTGDTPTAVAALIGKSIAGSALYCELYQYDVEGNWLLIANGGEGDLTCRDADRPVRFLPEDHYMGACGPGVAVAFFLKRGPATLVSLTPRSGDEPWVMAVADGEIIDSKHEGMEGPTGMFRFKSYAVEEGYKRWCEAGASHHAVYLPGEQLVSLSVAAKALGIEMRAV